MKKLMSYSIHNPYIKKNTEKRFVKQLLFDAYYLLNSILLFIEHIQTNHITPWTNYGLSERNYRDENVFY